MKVFIADKIDDDAFLIFKKNNIDFDYKPEVTYEELISLIGQFDVLIVRSRTKVTREVIDRGIKLKVVGRVGSGVDNINIESCKRENIFVLNAPDANAQAAAEHTIGLILSLLRHYYRAFNSMRDGLWLKKELLGNELYGKTIGIVGYGRVGKIIHKLVKAFGANVLIYSKSYQTVNLKDLFQKSDIVTLHLAFTTEARRIINKNLLSLMKKEAYFINTSRGEVVEESALYEILTDNKISGAALDVYWQEPLSVDSKWRKLDNVILTPHIGASTKEALKRASIAVIGDIVRVLRGEKPKYQVI